MQLIFQVKFLCLGKPKTNVLKQKVKLSLRWLKKEGSVMKILTVKTV